jgi:hypothetical protein
MNDGTRCEVAVTWAAPDGVLISGGGTVTINDDGIYIFTGAVAGTQLTARLTLTVVTPVDQTVLKFTVKEPNK